MVPINTDHPAQTHPINTADRLDARTTYPQGTEEFRDVVVTAITAAAAPAFVLGGPTDSDAALARTLLRSILAVVDSSPIAPAWSVAIMRHHSGISAFVTTNEDRGWLPSGLYLPRTVSTPWKWRTTHNAAWEGVADPARILAEFSRAWGRTTGAELVALASSLPIDPLLRTALPSVHYDGHLSPAAELKLDRPAQDRADRLGLTASQRLLNRIEAVPEPTIALRCTELARDAHTRTVNAIRDSVHTTAATGLRHRILTALRRRTQPAQGWWEQLRDADDLLAASMVSRRLDTSRIPLGELTAEHTGALTPLQAMQLQRRCNELVLLLGRIPDRQCLREAVYVHAHLTENSTLLGSARTSTPRPAGI
ncbi:hypothetical protein [Nocardia jejuensis]|uniref:hypothetical protein n=1 Tax=Nocardia jejuensis TaxID=328049 RepID=UPI0012F8FBD1|nr:hypothetical protein [Nocardia jejuensis]